MNVGGGAARRLVARLRAAGVLKSERVASALHEVPRHVFAHWLDEEEAYSDEAHVIPDPASGTPATISQPQMIVHVLEAARPPPGSRVLEIGAGSGYFAALLAHVVGPHGCVVAIDIEPSLVALAQANIRAAGIENVLVTLGDATEGYGPEAPYDLIVASVGVWEIPWSWLSQLAPAGSIVAPLHLGGGAHDHVLVHLERDGKGLDGRGVVPLSMVVARGPGAAPAGDELTRAGPNWRGAAVDRLKVRVLPKVEDLPVRPTQKVLEKRDSYVVLEASID